MKDDVELMADRHLNEVFTQYEGRFVKAFAEGLKEGKKKLLASLDKLSTDRAKLQALIPNADLSEIVTTIGKRRKFLSGG